MTDSIQIEVRKGKIQLDQKIDPKSADWMIKFCQKQIFDVLSRMSLGELLIVLPDGTKRIFGQSCNSKTINASGSTARERNNHIQAEIHVNDLEFFRSALLFADIGLSESYMDKLWDTPDIRAVISWMLLNVENSPVLNESNTRSRLLNLCGAVNKRLHQSRSNSLGNSKANIQAHYDLGNSFFQIFLDPSMTYSSALFDAKQQADDGSAESANLEAAQQAKYTRLARKMRLSASDHVLEIGCGWGGFSLFAAKSFGCKVTAVTISSEQFKYVQDLITLNHMEKLIDVQLKDYRLIEGVYDKIVSIEMIEAVGDEHLDTFFACCNRLLKRDGLLGLQMITSPDSRYDTLRRNVDFIQKHIFPGSLLPSLRRINQAMDRCGDLFLYDIHDLGASYVRTLKAWQIRFNRSRAQVEALDFDETFIRKWNYFFSYCQAAFDMRNITVVQAVYTRPNNLNLRD